MWKIWKSIDIIKRKWKEEKNFFEFLAAIRQDSACSESETKMADGAEEVGFQKYNHFKRFSGILQGKY